MSADSIQKLLGSLLGDNSSSANEETLFANFLLKYGENFSFSDPSFHEVLSLLISERFMSPSWYNSASRILIFRLFQVIRILTRDNSMQALFFQAGALNELMSYIQTTSMEYFSDKSVSYSSEILVELCSILKRFAANPERRGLIFDFGIHENLVLLLSSHDPFILHTILVIICHLSSSTSRFLDCVSTLPIIEPLIQVISENTELLPYKQFSAEILDVIANSRPGRSDISYYNGISIFLGFLNIDTEESLLLKILQILCKMAKDSEISREIRTLNGIPLLLAIINKKYVPNVSINIAIAVCSVLTQMALDDENSYQIRKGGGLYIVGDFLLNSNKELQLRALRTLRFLFSFERNRKYFKRLFPPAIFASFIDVGHYSTKLKAYEHVATMLSSIQTADIEKFQEVLNNFRNNKPDSVRGYVLSEVLGKGAFGTVYLGHKENGETQFAIKELPLKERFAGTKLNSEQINNSINNILKEVQILSDLNHPNIIKYYTSFVANDCLYIIMELCEGISLFDLINSMIDKKEMISEEKLWQIFIQICLALSYIHNKKGVVHRDITPSNIMLDSRYTVKIADFGLARFTHKESIMTSVVGTISYCCPEIVQNKSYTEKADIWSLGCVFYHLATLHPPFKASNPISVAQKIVNAEYSIHLLDSFSPQLNNIIQKMLTVDPEQRPGIKQLCSLISSRILNELDRVNLHVENLERELLTEKSLRSKLIHEFDRLKIKERNKARHIPEIKNNKDLLSSNSLPPRSSSSNRPNILPHLAPTTPLSITLSSSINKTNHLDSLKSPISISPMFLSDSQPTSSPSYAPKTAPASTPPNLPTLSISPNKLRHINDPHLQIFNTLHKIIFLVSQPPKLNRDDRRSALIRFQKGIFRSGVNGTIFLKDEMKKLIAGLNQVIEFINPDPLSYDPIPSNTTSQSKTIPKSESFKSLITYADLSHWIEELLSESNYYMNDSNSSLDSSSPRSSFKNFEYLSNKKCQRSTKSASDTRNPKHLQQVTNVDISNSNKKNRHKYLLPTLKNSKKIPPK